MLEQFKCPDGDIIKVSDCLNECRMAERCMTLPTLTLTSEEREWNGVASTTQLLNGTMMEYLKLTKPYCVDPDSRAFMLAGTKHHQSLERVAKTLGLPAEVALSVDRDIFDLIEIEDDHLVLTDYKLWGSFKVAKALGLVKVGMKPDPSGATYKTTTRWGKAGEAKQVPVFATLADQIDLWEVEYQQNRYRVKLEELGVKIARMQLQVTVRDGGLAVASSRGITRNVYRIPIKALRNEDVVGFFKFKDDQLQYALKYGWTTPCTVAETWEGKRCADYCDVNMYCPQGILANQNREEKNE